MFSSACKTSSVLISSVSTTGAWPGASNTYTGTPLRPNAFRDWVIRGSWRVQSARSNCTSWREKACKTWGFDKVVRLLNWQVTHQAAV